MLFIAIPICLLCSCQNIGQESSGADISSSKISDNRQTDTDIYSNVPSSKTESSTPKTEAIFSEVPDLSVQLEEGSKYSYCLVRREQTVLSRQDNSVCSSMYYEMPVVLFFDRELQGYVFDKEFQYGVSNNENAEIAAINVAFEQKCCDFFENAAEFTLLSQDLAIRHTGEYGIYCNQLETQVTQCDESIFSVRQILHWCTYGLETWSEFGLTFNMKTGELLSLDDFVDMDYDTFYETILNFIFDKIPDSWGMEPKRDFYGYLFHDFSDHDFYYKDGSLYIIFPAISNENGWIVRWSVEDSTPMECLLSASRSEP